MCNYIGAAHLLEELMSLTGLSEKRMEDYKFTGACGFLKEKNKKKKLSPKDLLWM